MVCAHLCSEVPLGCRQRSCSRDKKAFIEASVTSTPCSNNSPEVCCGHGDDLLTVAMVSILSIVVEWVNILIKNSWVWCVISFMQGACVCVHVCTPLFTPEACSVLSFTAGGLGVCSDPLSWHSFAFLTESNTGRREERERERARNRERGSDMCLG